MIESSFVIFVNIYIVNKNIKGNFVSFSHPLSNDRDQSEPIPPTKSTFSTQSVSTVI